MWLWSFLFFFFAFLLLLFESHLLHHSLQIFLPLLFSNSELLCFNLFLFFSFQLVFSCFDAQILLFTDHCPSNQKFLSRQIECSNRRNPQHKPDSLYLLIVGMSTLESYNLLTFRNLKRLPLAVTPVRPSHIQYVFTFIILQPYSNEGI